MRRFVRIAAVVCALTALALPGATLLAQAPAQTASQFYTDYRKAFDAARKVEDIIPFMSKETVAQVQSTPAADRAQMFEMIKMMGAITNMKIIKETRTGDGATLTVEALDPDKAKTTGTIQVVRENGAWKLGRESWSTK
jgi:hypothetical protein